MTVPHQPLEPAPAAHRLLAFYLPQFHPTPENDAFWGAGFTEWRNVVQGRPLFRGHYQPRLPADLGFYDLRLQAVREAQAALARQYGVHGFCYYHYWFAGHRPLGAVLDAVLRSGAPDLPFCLCWANEAWTRNWGGGQGEVLLPQTYSAADDYAHMRWLLPVFADARYLRVQGRPLLLVYRAQALPPRTVDTWRRLAQAAGFPDLYLCWVGTPAPGFDAGVGFAPRWGALGPPRWPGWRGVGQLARGLGSRALGGERGWASVHDYAAVARLAARGLGRHVEGGERGRASVHDGPPMVGLAGDALLPSAKPPSAFGAAAEHPNPGASRPPIFFPGIAPGFDNSARRRRAGATILQGSSPQLYGAWLARLLQRPPPGPEENFIFINAWNEWAEGAHLEPCLRFGHGFLQATQGALQAQHGRSPTLPLAAHAGLHAGAGG